MSDDGYIYNYGTPSNPVVDITGTKLQIVLNYQDKDAAAPTDHPLPQFVLDMFPDLNTPLSQTFDEFWSVTRDSDGKTKRDRVADQITALVEEYASQQGPTYDINVNLPTSGRLRALAAHALGVVGKVFLSYWLPGVDVHFTTTSAWTSGFDDPKFQVNFDIELLILSPIPSVPCQLTPNGDARVSNAKVSPANVTAELVTVLKGIGDYLSSQPVAVFQAVEGTIDSTHPPVDLGSLGTELAKIAAGCTEATKLGFIQFDVFTDANTRTLNFRLTHPVYPAPKFGVGGGNTFGPGAVGLDTDSAQVPAGKQVTVHATNLSVVPSTSITIGWTDPPSGATTESDIQFGPINGTLQIATVARQGADDARNFFTATGLTPNTLYQFRVRNSDLLTQTPWSDWVTKRTASPSAVDLALEYNAMKVPVGHVTVDTGGNLTTTITVPVDTPPGVHELLLLVNGNTMASTQITVLSPGQAPQPRLKVIALPPLDKPIIDTTQPFTLHGEGFSPGAVEVTLDSASSEPLGVTNAGGDGQFTTVFTCPNIVLGSYNIVATQTVQGQTVQAVMAVIVGDGRPPR